MARFTADLDLIVHVEPENRRRFISFTSDLSYRPRVPMDARDFLDLAKRGTGKRA